MVAYLDNIGGVPDAEDALTGSMGRGPQRQSQIRIVRQEAACLFCYFHCSQMRRFAWLVNETDGAIVEY